MSDPTREALMKAIRAAFDAGSEQGSDESTAWEWGSFPRQRADDAFQDFMADWNLDSEPLRKLLGDDQ